MSNIYDNVITPINAYPRVAPKSGRNLSASDRIVRVASAVAEAVEVFGDESKAIAWFKAPSLALGDESPIDLMTIDPGAKLVRDELPRIRYGHWA